MNLFLFLSLMLVLSPSSLPVPDGPADLQGTWKLVAVENNGEERTLDELQPRLRIKGTAVSYAKKEIAKVTADSSASPHTIDLQFQSPQRTFEGIYTIEGNTLKVCVNSQTEGVKERPNALSTKGQGSWRLMTFEREANPPADEMEGVAGFMGIALRAEGEQKAILVDFIIEGSPAEKAGFAKEDVVLKVANQPASTLQSTVGEVRKAKPGSKLEVLIRRNGKEMTITSTVGVRPFTTIAELDS
jgi:uncharacterized protein (TIGR03067 family)